MRLPNNYTLFRPISSRVQLIFTLLILLGLSACQTIVSSPAIKQSGPLAPLKHAYDFQIISLPDKQPLTVDQLAKQLKAFDIVFIGEFHGNHASHLLEVELLNALYQQRSNISLSMEMFNRDQQSILDRYLDSEIGETFLIKEAPTWQGYTGNYRPLVEYAKQHFIPIIAANAPADIVRCIGREGAPYLTKLPVAEREFIAHQPFTDNTDYRQRYMAFLEHARQRSLAHKERSYLAQLTRDNTMAESIYQAWLNAPEQQILHINGSFHSEQHLGTVSALKALAPKLKIAVISPIRIEDKAISISKQLNSLTREQQILGDFIYFVQPQPTPFLNAEYKNRYRKALFKQAEQAMCY